MAEARPEDIERNVRSLTALYVQMGGGLGTWRVAIRDFIRHVAESMAMSTAEIRDRDELVRDMLHEQRNSARPVAVAAAETATCAERPACPSCGRWAEDGHDADSHDTRTLCDGTVVALRETWVTREWAQRELDEDVSDWRNYEIEDALARRVGGAWVVAGPCPRNGDYCTSEGRWS